MIKLQIHYPKMEKREQLNQKAPFSLSFVKTGEEVIFSHIENLIKAIQMFNSSV